MFYNDIDKAIVNLIRRLIKGPFSEKERKLLLKWISKEEFNRLNKYDNWYSGFIRSCWSYELSGKRYFCNREKEKELKEIHNYLLENGYNGKGDKRNKLIKEYMLNKNKDYKNIRLHELENIEKILNFNYSNDFKKLVIMNNSYDEVLIDTDVDETIIYLDPPYNTGNVWYVNNDICYNKLDKYIRESKYKIYLSSYYYDNLNCVLEIKKNSHRCFNIERLYCNKNCEHIKYLF